MQPIPGSWHAVKYPDVKTWTVTAKTSIASRISDEATARLIAAAPDLLATLAEVSVGLQFWLDAHGDYDGRIASLLGMVNDAHDKATAAAIPQ